MLAKILEWVTPIMMSAIVGLLGFIATKLRTLPHMLLVFAGQLQAKAKLTPGGGDDVLAAFLMLFAQALEATLGNRAEDKLARAAGVLVGEGADRRAAGPAVVAPVITGIPPGTPAVYAPHLNDGRGPKP